MDPKFAAVLDVLTQMLPYIAIIVAISVGGSLLST